jgi:hypothetical protein
MPVLLDFLESHYLFQGLVVAVAFVFVSSFFKELADGLPYSKIPLVGRNRWEISNAKAKKCFVTSAKELIAQGFSQVRGAPFPTLELQSTKRALKMTLRLLTH